VANGERTILFLSAADNLRRLTLLAIPLLIVEFTPAVWRRQRLVLAAVGVGALGIAGASMLEPPIGLWEQSQPRFADYLAQHPVEPGASYRVLLSTHREDGMYEFMRAGATLSTEFFSESIHRNSFRDVD